MLNKVTEVDESSYQCTFALAVCEGFLSKCVFDNKEQEGEV